MPEVVAAKQAQQSVRVDPELWRRARVKALGEGQSMTAVVGRLLTGWLAADVPAHQGAPGRAPETTQATGPVGWAQANRQDNVAAIVACSGASNQSGLGVPDVLRRR